MEVQDFVTVLDLSAFQRKETLEAGTHRNTLLRLIIDNAYHSNACSDIANVDYGKYASSPDISERKFGLSNLSLICKENPIVSSEPSKDISLRPLPSNRSVLSSHPLSSQSARFPMFSDVVRKYITKNKEQILEDMKKIHVSNMHIYNVPMLSLQGVKSEVGRSLPTLLKFFPEGSSERECEVCWTELFDGNPLKVPQTHVPNVGHAMRKQVALLVIIKGSKKVFPAITEKVLFVQAVLFSYWHVTLKTRGQAKERSLSLVFENVDLALLNSLRAAVLDSPTSWAYHYIFVYKSTLADGDGLDFETLRFLLQQIPVSQFQMSYIRLQGPKIVTSRNLKFYKVPSREQKSEINEAVACIDGNLQDGPYTAIVKGVGDGPADVRVLSEPEDSRNNRGRTFREAIVNEFKTVILPKDVGCMLFRNSSNDGRISKTTIQYPPTNATQPLDISLFSFKDEEEIDITLVAATGSPLKDAKWSAVSQASCHFVEGDKVAFKMEVVHSMHDPSEVLRKAIQCQIDWLKLLARLIDEAPFSPEPTV
ncbi:hypothetical protein BDK51DRAFT_43375 [Blyttiomyces helicus]|uniref:Uncharacterized protein n=1 Tax=Blyttiomyces helicus TaxID=388810 RepID=A0A4P9WLL8_9FUNG|nr:hypothetical protein BDK51DRAFT_43375 [Blyttiomyces helicus]|eukprot:RKO93929.1 hypothetical protein BDK51DRAFT_43375 [Blyttiomyces helicus]